MCSAFSVCVNVHEPLSEHSWHYIGAADWTHCVLNRVISCRLSDLSHGLLVLDLSGAQQSQHVLGSLGHGVLHAVVMPQLLHAQLHPAQVRLAWDTVSGLVSDTWATGRTATCTHDIRHGKRINFTHFESDLDIVRCLATDVDIASWRKETGYRFGHSDPSWGLRVFLSSSHISVSVLFRGTLLAQVFTLKPAIIHFLANWGKQK